MQQTDSTRPEPAAMQQGKTSEATELDDMKAHITDNNWQK